jgi:hypothetical protein
MNIRSKLFYAYVCCVSLYAASFLIPRSIATMRTFELSTLKYRLLSLTVLIPMSLIWFAAFYGYSKLRAYTRTIHDTPDGQHVAKITTGLLFLVIGLPVTSLSSSVLAILVEHNHSWIAAGTIVKNYLTLLFPLLGFMYISRGARGLSELAGQRPSYWATNLLAAIFIILGIVYSYVILHSQNIETLYHLPVWLVLSTLAGPYLFMWNIGILAAFEVYLYSRKAPGVLYRRTWQQLALGIGAIMIMQITVQYVTLITVQFTQLRLLRLLIIIYILLASLSVGYILVALGAKRLQKIEEV